jgi:hypothetical protein
VSAGELRLGASWAAHDGLLVTVVEIGQAEPTPDGRRADDRLIAAMLRQDAERVIRAVNAENRADGLSRL